MFGRVVRGVGRADRVAVVQVSADLLRRAAALADDAQYVPGANVELTRALSLLLINEAYAMAGAEQRDAYYNGARRELLERLATAVLGDES